MSTKFPESFEVLSHLVKRLIKLCAQAPHSEKITSEYITVIEDIADNEDRLKAVLEIVGKDIYSILRSLPTAPGDHKVIQLQFDHEPEVYESMLEDWLLAISEDEGDEFYGLIELLPDEDRATIIAFLLSMMSFYVMFIQSET